MPTLFKRSNGIYYAISTDENGRRRWISTHQRLKSLALKSLVTLSTPPRPVHQKKLSEFLDEFARDKANLLARETFHVYQRAFRALIHHTGDIRMSEVSHRHCDL
jgi:hypothetical protein